MVPPVSIITISTPTGGSVDRMRVDSLTPSQARQFLQPSAPLPAAIHTRSLKHRIHFLESRESNRYARGGAQVYCGTHRQPPPGPHAAHARMTFARMIGGITCIRRSIARPTVRRRGKNHNKSIYRRADRIGDLHLDPACTTGAAAASPPRPGGTAGTSARRGARTRASTRGRPRARKEPARLVPRMDPGTPCT